MVCKETLSLHVNPFPATGNNVSFPWGLTEGVQSVLTARCVFECIRKLLVQSVSSAEHQVAAGIELQHCSAPCEIITNSPSLAFSRMLDIGCL